MKKFIALFAAGLLTLLAVQMVFAANHRSAKILKGSVATLNAASTNTGQVITVEWTNLLSQVITNGTNASGVYYGSWTEELGVPAWATSTGEAGIAAIGIGSYGSAATSTNTLTFTFVRSTDGTTWPATASEASGNDKFDVTFTQNGTNVLYFQTNVPTAFLSAAARVRLLQVANVGAGPGTAKITSITLNGYVP